MDFKIILNVILISVYFLFSMTKCECPPPEVTFPFVCDDRWNGKYLNNYNEMEFNITQLALNISEYYGNNVSDKHFTQLSFYNTYIKDFEENCLLDLTFNKIGISGHNNAVERIHENAFNSSMNTLELLYIWVCIVI